jgi:LysR family transcriptional regulator, transcriptional activator of nhaA
MLRRSLTVSLDFSYRHLYYFWVVAKEGGMARAAARLGMAVQTVSAQVRELERALGQQLLKPAGRGLALTEAGQTALHQAEQIFALGAQLPALVRNAVAAPQVRLAVGIGDGLSKLVVQRLLQPVLATPLSGAQLRLLCHEDEFDRLLADLALHRLDVVLSDRPAPANRNLRVYSHPVGTAPLAWYAPPLLAEAAAAGFPQSLAQVPVLLPTGHAALRPRLDAWFERRGVTPRIVGEFEDSALLVTFAAAGMGVFPAPADIGEELGARYGVRPVADGDGLAEQFFAIATERKVLHPLVQRLLPA